MTLLEEAKAHMETMREHTDCCGMPIFRRMVKEVESLQAALAPFAEFAGGVVGRPPADTPITMGSRMARRQLTMGDCVRAADALNHK